ncbi:MAG: rseP, partial [Burkholderiales bacterium]|nr:rseP [Burkholderiales bacterium]
MQSVLAFLITIGILVVVHEYGHYLFARIFKVKILTFSVGFGPKIFSYTSKSNEWRLSLIPFGGYVRMLNEREGIVNENEKHLAFNNKKPYQKILIALAGPLFNILFAVIVYYVIALIGVTALKPVISSIDVTTFQNTVMSNLYQNTLVPQKSLASATPHNSVITTPAQIIAIDGHQAKTWIEADKQFNQAVTTKSQFSLQLKQLSSGNVQTIDINGKILNQHFAGSAYLETIGLYPILYLPIISYIEPHSVADKSGLKINDYIVTINSKEITSWFQVAEIIRFSPGEEIKFKIKRGPSYIDFSVTPEGSYDGNGGVVGKLGIMPLPDQKMLMQNSFIYKYNMLHALGYAFNECYNVIKFNLVTLYQLVTNKVSLYNLGGPISIAKIGGVAIHNGLINFAEFLALISIGLAIMNLLPIPVLDGGHILIYVIELIIG